MQLMKDLDYLVSINNCTCTVCAVYVCIIYMYMHEVFYLKHKKNNIITASICCITVLVMSRSFCVHCVFHLSFSSLSSIYLSLSLYLSPFPLSLFSFSTLSSSLAGDRNIQTAIITAVVIATVAVLLFVIILIMIFAICCCVLRRRNDNWT